MDEKIIKIPNFKLNVFRKLLEQSLITDNQLMLQVSSEMIQSCSFSMSKTFMKLWTIPLNNLIIVEDEDVIEFEPGETKKAEKLDFPVFNFYILKGDLFKKYLSVHNTDMADIEFVLHKNGDKYQAANITISGKSENNSPLTTTFTLTTEDLITNKIDDYSSIIDECTPNKNSSEFVLTDAQIQEVKRLIKNLHKSSSDNTAFLTFTITKDKIIVNDKVFNITFPNSDKENVKEFQFNILKSDFVMIGNHSFTIFTNEDDQKVIFGAHFASSVIWCLSSKINENSIDLDDSNLDAAIDSLNLAEYGIDF